MNKITLQDVIKAVKLLKEEFADDYEITFKMELKPEALERRVRALKYRRDRYMFSNKEGEKE